MTFWQSIRYRWARWKTEWCNVCPECGSDVPEVVTCDVCQKYVSYYPATDELKEIWLARWREKNLP